MDKLAVEDISINEEVPQVEVKQSPTDELEDYKEEIDFNIKTDSLTALSIKLCYTDLIEQIKINDPKYIGHYALFGAAEALIRAAKLLLAAAPDKPIIAHSIANIANTISHVGEKITKENEDQHRENTYMESEEIDLIMKSIMGINVKIPEMDDQEEKEV